MTTAAYGQATRTWVSGTGDDVNPCSRTAPCKTWAGAISKTAAGGEINALDPGGYGALTITKSITIDGNGQLASSLSTGTSGFTINGDSNTVVTIRNVSINGGNSAFGSGIRILAAKAVNIYNVEIFNYAGTGSAGRGIDISSTLANTRVNVNNTRIFNVGNHGIASVPSAGNVILTVSNSHISLSNNSAIGLVSNTKASISNTVLTNNPVGAGIVLENSSVEAHLDKCILSNNAFGVFNGVGLGAPTTRISGCQIFNNPGDGLHITAGQVISHGNNAIGGNGGNQTPSSTVGTT